MKSLPANLLLSSTQRGRKVRGQVSNELAVPARKWPLLLQLKGEWGKWEGRLCKVDDVEVQYCQY